MINSKSIKNTSITFLNILLLSTIALMLFPCELLLYKYLASSLFIATVVLRFYAKKLILKRSIHYYDFLLLFFLIYSFLSGIYLTKYQLVWIDYFIYLQMIMVYFSSKYLIEEKYKIIYLKYVIPVLVSLFITVSYVAIMSGVEFGSSWVGIFGKNKNYCAAYLAVLSLYTVSIKPNDETNKKIIFIAKIILSIFCLTFSSITNSIGGMVISLYCVLYLFNKNIDSFSLRFAVYFLFFILSGIVIYELGNDFILSKGVQERYFLLKRSFDIFFDNPVVGVGLGNWKLEIYNCNLTETSFNHPYSFVRHNSHNLFSNFVVESGLIGILIIGIFFSGFFKEHNNRAVIEKFTYKDPICHLILSFLFVSSIYSSCFLHPDNFSELQYFVVFSLASFPTRQKHVVGSSFVVFIVLLSSIFLSLFFVKTIYDKHMFIAAKKEEVIELSIEMLEKLVDNDLSNFFTRKPDFYHALALRQFESGNIPNAEDSFLKALKRTPHSEDILLDFGDFLISIDSVSSAEIYLSKVESIQPNHVLLNLLLCELNYLKKDFLKSIDYYNNIIYRTTQYKSRIIAMQKRLNLYLQENEELNLKLKTF